MSQQLFNALSGLNVTPMDNPYGMASATVGQVAPTMISPYMSSGKAIGIGLGSILLQSLLGYQARQQAARESIELNTLANQMQQAKTAQERIDFIKSVEEPFYQGRLSTLAGALTQQEAARKASIDDTIAALEAKAQFQLGDLGTRLSEQEAALASNKKVAELEAAADFELGTKGEELYKRKLERDVQVAAAGRTPQQQSRQSLPTGVQENIVNATTFADAAQAHRARIAQMSPADLKAMLLTGTSGMGMFGEPGFIQENEAVLQLYRKSNFGATLTGQEKKAADIISGKTVTASKADILSAWDTLIDQSKKRAARAVQVASSTPDQLSQILQTSPTIATPVAADPETEAKLRRNAELKAKRDRLLAGQGR